MGDFSASKSSTDVVLVDVVGFSLLSDEEQLLTVAALTNTLRTISTNILAQGHEDSSDVFSAFVPTGDGFFIIMNPTCVGYGVLAALSIRNLMLLDIERAKCKATGVRCAAHYGTVIPFSDINGSRNFVGSGLNTCARLLDGDRDIRAKVEHFAGDRNYAIASEESLNAFRQVKDCDTILDWLVTMEWKQGELIEIYDKHGQPHRARPVEASRRAIFNPPSPQCKRG